MKRWHISWSTLALIVLACLLLVWVLRGITLDEVLATLAELDGRDLALLALVNVVVFVSFALRWWLLLCGLGHRIPFWRLTLYRLTSFSISYFTPGPHMGGEPYQVYATTQWHRIPASKAIAAVALDKLVEMLVNASLITAGVVLLFGTRLGLAEGQEMRLAAGAVALLALPVGVLAAQWQGHLPISWLILYIWRRRKMPRWFRAVRQAEDQAVAIWHQQPWALGTALLATLISMAGAIYEFWLMATMLKLPLSFLDVLSAFVVLRLAILLPMPAGLGAIEAGLAMAMASLGLDANAAVSMALVIRGRDLLLGIAGLGVGGVHVWERVAAGEKSVERVQSSQDTPD
jgi:uncharacterized protein (TIRG00374 family)